MIYKIFAFLLVIAVGIVPVTVSHNDGVDIRIEIEEPKGMIHSGDEVTLRCHVDGLSYPYIIHWQYVNSENNDTMQWQDIDCTGDTYRFVLTEENVGYYYRVIVTCDNDEYIATNFSTPTDM